MGRVINANSPGKIRNYHRRTVAELLRLLSQRAAIDEEAKDMTAAIIISLRSIHESTMSTIAAWEKRNYWTKADRFLREWEWANTLANELEKLVREDEWLRLPVVMVQLAPHFADMEIKKMTRHPSEWQGAYRQFLSRVEA